jgi:hypothetical protein
MRPIRDNSFGGHVHAATDESGHLKTACGLTVTGWWKLVDEPWRPEPMRAISCPVCKTVGDA